MDQPSELAGCEEETQARPSHPVELQRRYPKLVPVLTIFVLSRLAFYAAAFTAKGLVPEVAEDPVKVDLNAPLAVEMHWRWDAVHYYSIAVGDYNFYYTHPIAGNGPDVLYAFFPLLPLLTRVTAAVLGGLHPPAALPITTAQAAPLWAGVLVVHVASLVAFWLLFQLVQEETGDQGTAQRAVLYTAIFPLAFYYAVPYAEPLFLAASIGTFLAARRAQWIRAGLWAAAASAARPFGILLLPVLALEIMLAARRGELQTRAWASALLGLLLAPSGLLLFMLYLWQRTGNALSFIDVQQSDWNRNQVFPLTTLWRGLGYALHPTWSGSDGTYARTVLHTAIVFLFLAVLIISLRQWRPSYVLYGILLFTLFLSRPWPGDTIMHTLGRSAMIFFPVYITLAHWGRRPMIHQAILLLWLPLFGLLAAVYVSWYFVA